MKMKMDSWKKGLVFFFSTSLLVLVTTKSILAQSITPEEHYKKGMEAYQTTDMAGATQEFRLAAEANYGPGMLMYADLLDRAEDDALAVEWYKKALANKVPGAGLGLGRMMCDGEGVAKPDCAEGIRLVTDSAQSGHLPAMMLLARIYRNGEMEVKPDPAISLEWLTKAAEGGYQSAMTELAHVYKDGLLGVAPNPKEAQRWKEAADKIKTKLKEATR
ncbi:MAG: sel1 repeat family protein [Magnetococcus sp. DMHC-6]